MTHQINPNEPTAEFNLMQRVKRRMYAMRNGALADNMRARGLNYFINFGLNIPQLKEIAAELTDGPGALDFDSRCALAADLWANINTRESRLLAPMIFPPARMTPQMALRWLSEAQTTEVADHLCHSLLRQLPYAEDVAYSLVAFPEASPMQIYSALRLLMNLLILRKADLARLASLTASLTPEPLLRPLLTQINDEIAFLTED